MTTTSDKLMAAFRKVAAKYGYENVSADFTAFREFKVQWQRSFKWASFRVSDYLTDADEEVLEGLADTLFSRIRGEEETPYDSHMRDFVLRSEFCQEKRPIYLKRSRNLTRTGTGKNWSLDDSIQRLIAQELVPENKDIIAVWSTDSKVRRAASSSVLMRLISVSDALDDPGIPEYVVDYAVYTQYLRILKGLENFGNGNDLYTREEERLYPMYKEAERMFDKLCLYF